MIFEILIGFVIVIGAVGIAVMLMVDKEHDRNRHDL